MPEIVVHNKEPDHFDEFYITNISIPYLTIYNVKSSNETRADIHITKNEAIELYNALKERLENQVVSPSVDR